MENKTQQDFSFMNDEEYRDLVRRCVHKPIYFATPKKDEIIETITSGKRLFDTQVVIVDHIDYLIRHTGGNRENDISDTLQDLKRVAEDHGIILIIVSHVRKVEGEANMEDLKGSSSLYNDPECVVMLKSMEGNQIRVEVAKNKGEQSFKTFDITKNTGKMSLTEIDQTWEDIVENEIS